MVPEFVIPQEFAEEVQELPYPEGRAGALAEHTPPVSVPELDAPHAFETVQLTEQFWVPA